MAQSAVVPPSSAADYPGIRLDTEISYHVAVMAERVLLVEDGAGEHSVVSGMMPQMTPHVGIQNSTTMIQNPAALHDMPLESPPC